MAGLVEKFKYKSVEDVANCLEKDDFLSVIDIKSAYRSVAIDPDHSKYQGIRWDFGSGPFYMVDHRLCFGLKCGPFYFNLISEFVQRVLVERYDMRVVQYLDDFCVIGGSYQECLFFQQKVIETLRYLGFMISWKKVSSPATMAVYLGIEIDSEKMQLRLPEVKLIKLREALERASKKDKISRKNLEKLTGLLAHCATVTRGGSTYCRRLYDLLRGAISNRLAVVQLGTEAKADIVWWQKFAESFNGVSTIPRPNFGVKIISDASKKGFAAHCGSDWFAGSWRENHKFSLVTPGCSHWVDPPVWDTVDGENINELEFWPVLVAIKRWCKIIRSTSVTCITDNLQVHHMLKSGPSINRTCMNWIRELFWVCMLNEISIVPEYIRSEDNTLADSLSRLLYVKHAAVVQNVTDGLGLCCEWPLVACCRSYVATAKREGQGPPGERSCSDYTQSQAHPMEMLQEVL